MGLISRVSSRTYRKKFFNKANIIMAKIVFIVGGPGCGKGTQCERIVEKYGYCHLSSGDLLRAEVASGSEKGQQLQAIMTKGELVPNEMVLDMMKTAINSNSEAKGFLIDGYPRTVDQGKSFEEIVGVCCKVVYLEADNETMVHRLLERAKTSGRADDNEETIRKRLTVFSEQTKPVVEFYKGCDKVHQVDGLRSIEEVFGD